MPTLQFTTPGMSLSDATDATKRLQERLVALIDLELTLKHVHWNVVGPTFIGVHEMIDPQVAAVRLMVDATAERIATLGGSPNGLPGNLVAQRSWDDYDLLRDGVLAHLGALDVVYTGVVSGHREAVEAFEELDPITQDMLIDQTQKLEQFHWFVRAHLEDKGGVLATRGATTEQQAATRASRRETTGTREATGTNGKSNGKRARRKN